MHYKKQSLKFQQHTFILLGTVTSRVQAYNHHEPLVLHSFAFNSNMASIILT